MKTKKKVNKVQTVIICPKCKTKIDIRGIKDIIIQQMINGFEDIMEKI